MQNLESGVSLRPVLERLDKLADDDQRGSSQAERVSFAAGAARVAQVFPWPLVGRLRNAKNHWLAGFRTVDGLAQYLIRAIDEATKRLARGGAETPRSRIDRR